MPNRFTPGCVCCTPPYCCDGTPPSSFDVTIASVAGNVLSPFCVGVTTCAAEWNVTKRLSQVGSFCVWSLTDFDMKDICTQTLGCGGFAVQRDWRYQIYNIAGTTWHARLDIGVTWPSGGGGAITTRLLYEHTYASRPTCNAVDLDISPTFTSVSHSSSGIDACCDFSSSTANVTSVP